MLTLGRYPELESVRYDAEPATREVQGGSADNGAKFHLACPETVSVVTASC
jgi:hypothetical protein